MGLLTVLSVEILLFDSGVLLLVHDVDLFSFVEVVLSSDYVNDVIADAFYSA